MKHIRLITSTGLTCCLFLMGVGWAHGQRDVRERDRTDVRTQETRTTTGVRRTSTVLGARVRLEDNVSYGEVKDFVFNDNGCIDYVVIAYEDDYVLVPWGVATFDFEQRTVRIDITKEKIRQLTFTKDRWPNLSDAGYTRKLRTVFGDRAERREHRTGRDGTRDSRDGDRNNRDVERRNDGSTGREPARDNRDKAPRSDRDDRQPRDRDTQDNRSRDPKSGQERRDNQAPRDRDTPRRSGDEKKPERSDRPKP